MWLLCANHVPFTQWYDLLATRAVPSGEHEMGGWHERTVKINFFQNWGARLQIFKKLRGPVCKFLKNWGGGAGPLWTVRLWWVAYRSRRSRTGCAEGWRCCAGSACGEHSRSQCTTRSLSGLLSTNRSAYGTFFFSDIILVYRSTAVIELMGIAKKNSSFLFP